MTDSPDPSTQATAAVPAAPASSGAPPPARVPWNRWTELAPALVGSWEPSRSLSVILAGGGAGDALQLTLSALREQTYPRALVQVLFHGEPPVASGELAQLMAELEVVALGGERDSADAASGDILLFLPEGSIPSQRTLEAHARWHHLVSDAAVLGARREIALTDIDPAGLGEALREDRLAEFLAPSERPDPWQERQLERTDELRDDRLDLFRVGLGGNHSLRAETLRSVGGAGPPLAVDPHGLGLAYRLAAFGALLVPDRDALAWTAVPQPAADDDADDDLAAPELIDLIPLGGLRPRTGGRIFQTPTLAVTMAVVDEPADVVAAAVDTALGGSFNDLAITLEIAEGHPERGFLEASFASDPRVSVTGEGGRGDLGGIPFQVFLPPSAVADGMTFQDILDVITEEPVGALYVTVPGRSVKEAVVRVFSTGALARARRVATGEEDDEEAVIAELFGQRWISGVEVGIHDWRDPAPRLADQGPLATIPELVRERARSSREKARAERERAEAKRERAGARDVRERAARAEAESARAQERAARTEAQLAEEEKQRKKASGRLEAVERSRSYRLARLMSRSSAAVRRRARGRG